MPTFRQGTAGQGRHGPQRRFRRPGLPRHLRRLRPDHAQARDPRRPRLLRRGRRAVEVHHAGWSSATPPTPTARHRPARSQRPTRTASRVTPPCSVPDPCPRERPRQSLGMVREDVELQVRCLLAALGQGHDHSPPIPWGEVVPTGDEAGSLKAGQQTRGPAGGEAQFVGDLRRALSPVQLDQRDRESVRELPDTEGFELRRSRHVRTQPLRSSPPSLPKGRPACPPGSDLGSGTIEEIECLLDQGLLAEEEQVQPRLERCDPTTTLRGHRDEDASPVPAVRSPKDQTSRLEAVECA